MDNLIINSTKKYIPYVNFNAKSGVLKLSGQCYMEHTDRFFIPIFEWIREFIRCRAEKNEITFNIELSYLNTSAAKRLYELFKLLETYNKNNNLVQVNWVFDDDDDSMLETYKDYKDEIKLPFNHIQKSSK